MTVIGAQALLDDLRSLVQKRQIVAIVGAGATMSATKSSVASWKGLLLNGISHCAAVVHDLPADWAKRKAADVEAGDVVEYLNVAEDVCQRLGAPANGEYARWLRETVGQLRVAHGDVLEALAELQVPLLTTNYDSTLSDISQRRPVTWREGRRVERVLRGDEEGIIHLHGHWEDPDSVVLGVRSYEELLRDERAQAIQKALAVYHSFLLVGFGAGMADPNFSRLRQWLCLTFRESEARRYRLVRASERASAQGSHAPDERTFALSYGEQFEDLAPFIRSLVPRATPPAPTPVLRTTVRVSVRLDLDIDPATALADPRVREVYEALRRISEDTTIRIRKVRRGSLDLVVECSIPGFERILRSHEQGDIHGRVGVFVLSVQDELGRGSDVAQQSVVCHLDHIRGFEGEWREAIGLVGLDTNDIGSVRVYLTARGPWVYAHSNFVKSGHSSPTKIATTESRDVLLLLTNLLLGDAPSVDERRAVVRAHAEGLVRYFVSRKCATARGGVVLDMGGAGSVTVVGLERVDPEGELPHDPGCDGPVFD